MLYEDLRAIHEDVERLEQGIADRVLEDPPHIRNRLVRDHEIANFLSAIQTQSQRALHLYKHEQAQRTQEVQAISTGDPFEEFYKQLYLIRDFHKRYPNEPVENLERAYKKTEDGGASFAGDIDGMFTGEEAFGRFFDLTMLHEEYLNLPGVKGVRKLTYLQYLDIFDKFLPPLCTIGRHDKLTDAYFGYIRSLAEYLESFMRKTKPLEDLDKLFQSFDYEFAKLWEENDMPGWSAEKAHTNGTTSAGPATEGSGEGVWCTDCSKEFKNNNVYKAHLTGNKHIKNAKAHQQKTNADVDTSMTNVSSTTNLASGLRLQERAVAIREHRISKLAAALKTEREDTRVNVERKAGMTDRERQQELAALYAEDSAMVGATAGNGRNPGAGGGVGGDDGEEEKVYNPLKLPLAWDGKPIPFWLYKLHGLGVEFPCEICGNYVYMGRRAFDKHFGEARHVYGLKCLGITNTSLFREITRIDEAERLWDKVQRDRKMVLEKGDDIEECEDYEGNVMPRKVYDDLQKAGLL